MIMEMCEIKNKENIADGLNGKAIIIQDFIMNGNKKDFNYNMVYVDGKIQIVKTDNLKYAEIFCWKENVEFEFNGWNMKGCLIPIQNDKHVITFEINNLKMCTISKDKFGLKSEVNQ
ncbi:MAG: hypothetical protein ACOCP4_07710 [Candidatus Woesearchaeota archaeon]